MTKANKQARTNAREPESFSIPDPRFADWEDYRARSIRPTEGFMKAVLALRAHDLPVEERQRFD